MQVAGADITNPDSPARLSTLLSTVLGAVRLLRMAESASLAGHIVWHRDRREMTGCHHQKPLMLQPASVLGRGTYRQEYKGSSK